jgi:hypothetical protein
MPSSNTIFISYNERDRERAAKIVRLLEGGDWTVWWDRRIPAGFTWRDVLADALARMDCMIVLWSRNSIDSDWVCEEASEGQRLGKLVPVAIDPVLPPVGFRQIQAADLSKWDGSPDAVEARQLLEDLATHVRQAPRPDAADRIDEHARHRGAMSAAAPPEARLAGLRTRMITARDSTDLQHIGWEVESLQREWPDWLELRALRTQLDEAVLRARRTEASAGPPHAQTPMAAHGAPRWLIAAALALGLAALLAWWLWPRQVPGNAVQAPAVSASRAESRPDAPQIAPANAADDRPVDAARPQPAAPGKPPIPKTIPGTPSEPLALERCSELNSRLSLGEPLSAADRTWLQKECKR